MRNAQPTTSLLGEARAADDQNQGEAAVIGGEISPSLPSPPPARNGITNDTVNPIRESEPASPPLTYPVWPTSQPGPQITSPGPGQKLHRRRTDQVVYTCYDQERGMPCVSPPSPVVRKQATAHPRIDLRQEQVEALAYQRWLDDGGTRE